MAQASAPSAIAALMADAAARNAKVGKSPGSAKPAEPALVWETISPDDLAPEVREAYFAIGRARSTFEAMITELLDPPAHLKLAFAYKRGLAIALAPRSKPNTGLAGLMARITSAED